MPPLPPLPPSCMQNRSSVHGGEGTGVAVLGRGSKCRMEGCEVWGNRVKGCMVRDGGELSLARCAVRDHASGGRGIGGTSCGVYVHADAGGLVVEPDCVFARNPGGDVVREEL